MIEKYMDLELAKKLLEEPERELSGTVKKAAAQERKRLKEYREEHPIEISITFEQPDWN